MSRGRMVAQGTVDELLADDGKVRLEVGSVPAAVAVLSSLAGVVAFETDGSGLVVDLDGVSRASVVAALVAAGVDVLGVASRRRLEDVFLELLGTDS